MDALMVDRPQAADEASSQMAAAAVSLNVIETGPRVAFTVCGEGSEGAHAHDLSTKREVARGIASVLDGVLVGDDAAPSSEPAPRHYVVPSHTLIGHAEALRLRIRGPEQFFGGLVPHAFVASKVITHGLVHARARAPLGWSHAHAGWIADVVLPGFSAFSVPDVREAALRLFPGGSIRLKLPDGVGGLGQIVVRDAGELETALRGMDVQALTRDGLVVERNLREVRTLSVGHVQVGTWTVSYVGTQDLTTNGQGEAVYGGSRLHVVRGELAALLEMPLADPTRLAVQQAMCYHEAAFRSYPEMMASRCNYDIAQGTDDEGRWRSGVLEQSWRIGGASGAEVAALQVLRRQPQVRVVTASTHEVYGASPTPPAGAWVTYDGLDRHGDALRKYVLAAPAASEAPASAPLPASSGRLGRKIGV